MKKIAGQESWILETANVKAAVTRQAGHLGPVSFRIGGKWISPFDLAPWAEEKIARGEPPVAQVMRGDFFCMPFGGNQTPYKKENHPPHGETANNRWKLESNTDGQLHTSLQTKVRKGRVDKFIQLIPGHSAVYSRHILSGMTGPMSFGHHAILHLREQKSGRVSLSHFGFGQVYPLPFENPEKGGYSILKPGAKFKKLQRVPRVDGKWADLSVYPDREGYEDLVLFASDARLPFAWTALTVPDAGYVWFALKDPKILASTVFWMSNGGRHYAPWSGRHRGALGLEEVTSYFHEGLAESTRTNSLNRAGIPTCVNLNPKSPLTVNYIMAVSAIPRDFDIVKNIEARTDGKSVVLTSASGKSVSTPIDLSFLSKTEESIDFRK